MPTPRPSASRARSRHAATTTHRRSIPVRENDMTAEATPVTRKNPRRKLMGIAAGVFAVLGIAYFGYWYVELRHFERTDNAYVQGNLVQLTPQIAGTVVAVNADDTDFVK